MEKKKKKTKESAKVRLVDLEDVKEVMGGSAPTTEASDPVSLQPVRSTIMCAW